jgi:uncharacterized protein YsxB (DUF464 family)
MNSITIRKDSAGRFCGFTSSGHAGFAKKGNDVACAAISVLTLTAVIALERLTILQPKVRQDTNQTILECNWTNEPTQVERSDLIMEIMLLGLREIQKQYPKHLRISEVEV